MKRVKVFNVIDDMQLDSVALEDTPHEGDPIELNHEMYYVCERIFNADNEIISVGVIPLVVKTPNKVKNIHGYLNCLSIAHRRVTYLKENKPCEFDDCDEVIIS